MKRIYLVIALMILAGGTAYAGEVVSWKDAANHYGKYKAVEGTIVATKCTPKVCFLNFHPDYKTSFTAVIFASDWPKFPPNPDKYYLNKKVEVTGSIKEYKGKPEIILKDASQIKILGTSTSDITDDNPDEIKCFKKIDLQGGTHMWRGNDDVKCVERKYIHCYIDESVPYPPSICIDRRDGSFLSFTD